MACETPLLKAFEYIYNMKSIWYAVLFCKNHAFCSFNDKVRILLTIALVDTFKCLLLSTGPKLLFCCTEIFEESLLWIPGTHISTRRCLQKHFTRCVTLLSFSYPYLLICSNLMCHVGCSMQEEVCENGDRKCFKSCKPPLGSSCSYLDELTIREFAPFRILWYHPLWGAQRSEKSLEAALRCYFFSVHP